MRGVEEDTRTKSRMQKAKEQFTGYKPRSGKFLKQLRSWFGFRSFNFRPTNSNNQSIILTTCSEALLVLFYRNQYLVIITIIIIYTNR